MSTALAVHHGPFGRAALYALDRPMVMHAHREGHLILHLDGPPAAVPVEAAVHPVSPGRAVAVSPWQPHGFEPAHPHGTPTLLLVAYLRPAWLAQATGRAPPALRVGRAGIEATALAQGLARRIARAIEEAAVPERAVEEALAALAREAFGQSWRRAGHEAPAARPAWDRRVRRSLWLMQERVGEGIALDAIAREAGLSRPHFYRLFRRQVGVTPNVYLNTLRMERAIARLSGGEAVTEIGLDLGFSSQASFSRFFAANVGIPPGDYRRSLRVANPA